MLPNFLFPETEVRKDGEGPALPLDESAGQMLQLTLGITATLEQQSLDVSVFGSADGTEWGAAPLVSFPQKFYTGVYTMVLDLTQFPEVCFLKIKYKTGRWGHWTTGPQFTFYVVAEPLNG